MQAAAAADSVLTDRRPEDFGGEALHGTQRRYHEEAHTDGDCQWMTAGSGIIHQEMPLAAERMLGCQLWVNLPKKDKMAAAGYQGITDAQIPAIALPGDAGSLRVIAGEYDGHRGPAHTFSPINVWDVRLAAGKTIALPQPEGWTTLVVVLAGTVQLNGETVLRAAQMATLSTAGSDVTLEVSVPRATPGFDTPRIAYVERPYAIDYYSRSEWADTPARMLGPLLAAAFERSGAFRAVVLAPTSAQAELRVDVELVRLQQDFTIKPSRADLALRVQVVDARARRVLATLVVEETEPAATQDAYGGVAATNAALKRAIERTVAFVLGEAAAIRPTGP